MHNKYYKRRVAANLLLVSKPELSSKMSSLYLLVDKASCELHF